MLSVAAYSLAHFSVDLGCAYSCFAHCSAGSEGFLLYNFFAFAMQMPLGLLADRFGRGKAAAAVGCVMTALLCFVPDFGLVGAAVLGLGNALFHIGGGVEILYSSHRARSLGIFVSPGALGLFFGTQLGRSDASPFFAAAAIALALAAVCLCRPVYFGGDADPKAALRKELFPAALLFAVVVLRSFAGMSGSFPWKTGTAALAAVLCTASGKALGGLTADRFGVRIAGSVSLLLSALLFLFSRHTAPGLAAILLFNMSMPVTLHGLTQRLPNCRGYAFGILTFALFVGFVPTYLGAPALSGGPLALCAVISALLLLPALRK